MKQSKSIHMSVHEIFLQNPDRVYTTADLVNSLDLDGKRRVRKEILTMILTRLHNQGSVLRTPSQLTKGYYYSQSNKGLLQEIHEDYLIPYDLPGKRSLIDQISQTEFQELKKDQMLNLNLLGDFGFVEKYSIEKFTCKDVQCFLSVLTGFLMCDGHLGKKLSRSYFFFRRKKDAEQFVRDFKGIFGLESLRITSASVGNSYVTEVLRSSNFSKLIHALGVPKGNKVFQPFLIPNWIYHGSDEVKRSFLSTVIGNEGSAPSDGRWRIQFVLSKSKEYIPNLLDFLNQIRAMLYYFGITTSYIQLRKQAGRQFHGRFYIKGKKNLGKFYKHFRFSYASEKQEVLEELILRSEKRNDHVNTI